MSIQRRFGFLLGAALALLVFAAPVAASADEVHMVNVEVKDAETNEPCPSVEIQYNEKGQEIVGGCELHMETLQQAYFENNSSTCEHQDFTLHLSASGYGSYSVPDYWYGGLCMVTPDTGEVVLAESEGQIVVLEVHRWSAYGSPYWEIMARGISHENGLVLTNTAKSGEFPKPLPPFANRWWNGGEWIESEGKDITVTTVE